jgi:hypothetical protein
MAIYKETSLIRTRMVRVDILCSIAIESKPRFGAVNLGPHLDLKYSEPYSLLGVRYETKLPNLAGLQDLSQEMITVFNILRHLKSEEDRFSGVQKIEITETEFESLRSYTNQLIHRLIALVQHKLPESSSRNASVYRLFGNAALTHIVIFSHFGPPLVCVPRLMSTRIRTNLETISIRSFQIEYPDMILWAITMGGLASIGTVDQEWFVKLLAESCCAAGIAGTAELAISLREFLWSDFYLDSTFKEFWNEVEMAQARRAVDETGGMVDELDLGTERTWLAPLAQECACSH